MSEIDNEILMMSKDLELGETFTTSSCPSCDGGIQKDRAFTITRMDQGYVYNCFRASCGLCGFVPTARPAKQTTGNNTHKSRGKATKPKKTRAKNFTPKMYTEGTININNTQSKYLQDKYTMSKAEIDSTRATYNLKRNTYVFPIYGRDGTKIGVVDRDYTNGRKPKAITYLEQNEPLLHFPLQFAVARGGPTYLVEDQLSATKVSRYANSVALLGCNLTDEGVQVLKNVTDSIIFALDGDATNAALRLRKKYAGIFKRVAVVQLVDDPKDMSDESLRGVFGRR